MEYSLREEEEAHKYKNEYFFGSELIVNPITSRTSPVTRVGSVKTWLKQLKSLGFPIKSEGQGIFHFLRSF